MNNKDFEVLINKNKDSIWRLCRMYIAETERCKDMYQDIIIQIWKSLPSFKGQSSIETWIYRIAINTCIKASLKIRRYEKEMSLEDFERNLQTLPESENERYESLYLCISKLGNIDKVLIGLYLEEQPYKEIAQVLGITENHVAVKLTRVKKTLQNCLLVPV